MATIRKREGRNRPWEVRYWAGGRQRSKSFTYKKAAERFARQVETELEQGSWVDPGGGDMEVCEWLRQWLATRSDLAPSSRAAYERAVRTGVEPRLRGRTLAQTRPSDVRAVMADLVEAGRAPRTVRLVHAVLRSGLAAAVEDGRLRSNPAEGVRAPALPDDERRFLSYDEVARLAAAMAEPYGGLVWFLAYTGLRWAEMASLTVGDVDLGQGELSVLGKGNKRRRVPIAAPVRPIVETQVDRRGADGWLWPSPTGRQLLRQSFLPYYWHPAVERAGLGAGITPHTLRHTCASWLARQGAGPYDVMRWLGHRDIRLTIDTYTHLFPDQLSSVAERLSEIGGKDAVRDG